VFTPLLYTSCDRHYSVSGPRSSNSLPVAVLLVSDLALEGSSRSHLSVADVT